MDFISDLFRGRDWINKLPKGTHKLTRYHWYNMVLPSPWPILLGTNTLPIVLGLVGYLQGINNSLEMFITGFLSFLFIFTLWNRDIIRESTFMGVHTKQVDANTILGFKLFLFSEIMLFFSFFWAHLYSALYPSVFIGLSWPPVGLADLLLDPFDIPLTNTVILVYSGFTVTLSHLYLRRGSIFLSAVAMLVTILFGLAFLYIQYTEYANAEFDISDGIYGCTFYMLTGFHGGHVIIGVSALIITLVRLLELHFSSYSHTGFKLALIYWHFVDVVWIFVFLIVYVLGYDLTYPNIIYYPYTNRLLGCVVNIDQAFFGKWWRGVQILQDTDYLDNVSTIRRLTWFQIFIAHSCDDIKLGYGADLLSKHSTYKTWFTTKKIPQYTTSEFTKDYYDSLINDQSVLSKVKTLELFKNLYGVYQNYYAHFRDYTFFGFVRLKTAVYCKEMTAQWLYGWEAYQKKQAHSALNTFYVFKILPSVLKDSQNGEEGLNNFYGKLVIFSESHKIIDKVTIKDHMDDACYTYGFKTWKNFWPNNHTKGGLIKLLRVFYLDGNETRPLHPGLYRH